MVRALTSIEQAMEVLNRRAGSFNVVTTSRVRRSLSEEIVQSALNLVQYRHPYLSYRILGELNDLHFDANELPKIPVRVVDSHYEEQWQDVVREELNEKIESDKGLMRAIVVRPANEDNSCYLITTVHHAICDGLSCVQLHLEILRYCQKIASGEPVVMGDRLPALPPIDMLLPESIQGFKAKWKSVLFLLRSRFQISWHRPKMLEIETGIPLESRYCGMVHRTLEGEIAQQFLTRCQQEMVTAQSALCAAMLLAATNRIESGTSRTVSVSCQSYVDLRRRLDPIVSKENIGMLASAVQTFHKVTPNMSLWQLARDVKQNLDASLKRDDIFCVGLMFRKIIEIFLNFPDWAPATVAVTNVGRVNIPDELPELEEISFVVGQRAYGGIFVVAVSTVREKMLLNFMFSEPSISKDMAQSLADDVVAHVCEASTVCKNVVFRAYPKTQNQSGEGAVFSEPRLPQTGFSGKL